MVVIHLLQIIIIYFILYFSVLFQYIPMMKEVCAIKKVGGGSGEKEIAKEEGALFLQKKDRLMKTFFSASHFSKYL